MSHGHHHDYPALGLRTAFFLNLGFTAFEIAGGLWTNSVAILSDAVHDLGDSVALASSWWLERISSKGRTVRQTFGYRRHSVLGAVISSLILIFGSVYIMTQAIPRLLSPADVRAEGMVGIAVVGVVVNSLAVLRLRGGEQAEPESRLPASP